MFTGASSNGVATTQLAPITGWVLVIVTQIIGITPGAPTCWATKSTMEALIVTADARGVAAGTPVPLIGIGLGLPGASLTTVSVSV